MSQESLRKNMRQGIKGQMNRDFSECYDQEDDIYYVTFNTGEPSYCKEVDDVLLLEMGIFTNMPTGFRILNFNKNKVGKVQITVELIQKIKDALPQDEIIPRFRRREQQVEEALERVLA